MAEVLPDQKFIERLRAIIEQAGSAEKLAKSSGVSARNIGKYLTGTEPSRKRLISLAEGAGVNVLWLATGEGEMRQGAAIVKGNGIIQGDSNHINIAIRHPMRRATDRVAEQSVEYGDPVSVAFLRDWLSLNDVARMRVWTMVKEEIERGKPTIREGEDQ